MKEQIKELKPCPFCGGKAKYMKAGWLKGTPPEFADWVMIICPECLCTTEAYESIAELTLLWNKRAVATVDYKGLKTCPHCGGKARVFTMRKGNYRVQCAASNNHECCLTSSGFTSHKKEAINAWNRRTDDEGTD